MCVTAESEIVYSCVFRVCQVKMDFQGKRWGSKKFFFFFNATHRGNAVQCVHLYCVCLSAGSCRSERRTGWCELNLEYITLWVMLLINALVCPQCSWVPWCIVQDTCKTSTKRNFTLNTNAASKMRHCCSFYICYALTRAFSTKPIAVMINVVLVPGPRFHWKERRAGKKINVVAYLLVFFPKINMADLCLKEFFYSDP